MTESDVKMGYYQETFGRNGANRLNPLKVTTVTFTKPQIIALKQMVDNGIYISVSDAVRRAVDLLIPHVMDYTALIESPTVKIVEIAGEKSRLVKKKRYSK